RSREALPAAGGVRREAGQPGQVCRLVLVYGVGVAAQHGDTAEGLERAVVGGNGAAAPELAGVGVGTIELVLAADPHGAVAQGRYRVRPLPGGSGDRDDVGAVVEPDRPTPSGP